MPRLPTMQIPTQYYGMWTLYSKEVRRFLKVYNQTLLAPVVTALLFLAIFSLAIGRRQNFVAGVSFQQFMAAGLIMMTTVQQAFANTSSSLTMGKVLGTVIDYLMPPISSKEMLAAMVAGGLTRGLVVGTLTGIAILPFVHLSVAHVGMALFYIVMASMMMSLLGILAGIISETFDHMSAITSYIITPLAFLSGTFYSIRNLPEFWQYVTHGNPFFYMIDGFRYAMTGYHDGSIQVGVAYLIAFNLFLIILCERLLAKGWRIKS